jgi:hypothetical protein
MCTKIRHGSKKIKRLYFVVAEILENLAMSILMSGACRS